MPYDSDMISISMVVVIIIVVITIVAIVHLIVGISSELLVQPG